MASFRVQTHENCVVKHHLDKNIKWSQPARWAWNNHLGQAGWSVQSVKQLSPDVVQIVKRKDQNFGFWYKYFGSDQQGFYERVTIDRKNNTVAIDRLDGNWVEAEPFIGRRDYFYFEQRDEDNSKMNGYLTFVRTDFWLAKLLKTQFNILSHYSAWSYKRQFKNTPQ